MLLEVTINKYLSENKINEAEDAIFEALETDRSEKNLIIALNFYNRIPPK